MDVHVVCITKEYFVIVSKLWWVAVCGEGIDVIAWKRDGMVRAVRE